MACVECHVRVRPADLVQTWKPGWRHWLKISSSGSQSYGPRMPQPKCSHQTFPVFQFGGGCEEKNLRNYYEHFCLQAVWTCFHIDQFLTDTLWPLRRQFSLKIKRSKLKFTVEKHNRLCHQKILLLRFVARLVALLPCCLKPGNHFGFVARDEKILDKSELR